MRAIFNSRAARLGPGNASAAVVQRAAKTAGVRLAGSIQQLCARRNHRTNLTSSAIGYLEKVLIVLMARIAKFGTYPKCHSVKAYWS